MELPVTNEDQYLVNLLFDNEKKIIHLKQGEMLHRKGDRNTRLYIVCSGKMDCSDEEGIRGTPGDLLGLHSFFITGHISQYTITAAQDSTLRYADLADIDNNPDPTFWRKVIVPIIVNELKKRGNIAKQREEQTQKQIQKMESLALLGQLSAGVAHELNNALAVIARGCEWIQIAAQNIMKKQSALERELFNIGLKKGRQVTIINNNSNSDTDSKNNQRPLRDATQLIIKKTKLSFAQARHIAKFNLTKQQLDNVIKHKRKITQLADAWELGATHNDMLIAANHSQHVVTSMRQLGSTSNYRTPYIHINQTIASALSILADVTRDIQVTYHADADPTMTCNSGELVQIWTNIIKNAADAIHTTDKPLTHSQINIATSFENQNIIIKIQNNGPEIPPDILPNIFKPNVTTKEKNLSFGLGIGLTLVQRLVSEYRGNVTVTTSPQSTHFTITFPLETNK